MNASPGSPIDAGFVLRWLDTATTVIEREARRLTDLDSPIGDSDHGTNMRRGFVAARTAVGQEPPDSPGGVLVAVGRQLISTVGGASGPLYGTLLRRAGKALGEGPSVSAAELRDALRAGVDGVAQLGGAAPGDKTMMDALIPAIDAMTKALDAGESTAGALRAAARAADKGAEATIPLRARKGRASYLGDRSIGHQDPGATSSALLITAFADTAVGAPPGPPGPGGEARHMSGSGTPAHEDDGPALVGIVLVSHSATAAASVAELATALSGAGDKVRVAPAGGGPDGGVGTSSDLIATAARTVDRGAGVAVLADLGSAVLTVKALLADDELPSGTRLVDAPFLEGAVAAVVTASTGADLDAVAAAAGDAYTYRKV